MNRRPPVIDGRATLLVSAETSRALDTEAQTEWGFNVFSLVESAGRLCAQSLTEAFPAFFTQGSRTKGLRISVAAGTGNNAADAMVMLRYFILSNLVDAGHSALILSRHPKEGEKGPWVELLMSLKKMNVSVLVWESAKGEGSLNSIKETFAQSDIIIDAITGTGLSGPLRGTALEMAEAINATAKLPSGPSALTLYERFTWPTPCYISPSNALTGSGAFTWRPHCPPTSYLLPLTSYLLPLVVSLDLPSGNFDGWKSGMPIIKADLTLAIEPQKYCLYTPAARPYAGTIVPVNGVFPGELIASCKGAELLDWESAGKRVRKVRPDAYKNERGTVEIWAGSAGASGAALIAARGAQAGGAGLVRLVVDDGIYPVLAVGAGGIMVSPVSSEVGFEGRFKPDAVLLGPGWGTGKDRLEILKKALVKEGAGTALILDADAIELAGLNVFSGNVILTPHPGELSKFTGIEKEELLSDTSSILLKCSRDCNGTILFKSHVLTIASPDGRLAVVDGMRPGLAAGGSGDLLAGLCAAIAARMKREGCFDAYTCAAAAASLLVASAGSDGLKTRFTDPLEIADRAADLAGKAWL